MSIRSNGPIGSSSATDSNLPPAARDDSNQIIETDHQGGGTPWWASEWESRYDIYKHSASALQDRQINVTLTTIDSTIPACYGNAHVTGTCGCEILDGTQIHWGIVFAQGEQNSVTTFRASGNALSVGTPSWVDGLGTAHTGDGTTALDTELSGNVTADDWQSWAHWRITVDATAVELPTNPTFTALCTGQKFTNFPNNETSGTTSNHTLVADVAYDILTAPYWCGISSARIDTGAGSSWAELRTWCNEAMGDASKRYICRGPIYQRQTDAALKEVLAHAFASLYMDDDGLVKVWAEMPPPALSGTVSAFTSDTLTTTADLTSELSVGEYFYIDGYWDTYGILEVAAITSNSVTCISTDGSSPSMIVSATNIRRLHHGGIYIEQDDWARLPTISDVDQHEIADIFRLKWSEKGNNSGQHQDETQIGSNTDKVVEMTLSLIADESQAARTCETWANLEHARVWRWTNGIDRSGKAAQLDIGDVFLIDDGVNTKIPVRLYPPKTNRFKVGQIQLREMVIFEGDVWSNATS